MCKHLVLPVRHVLIENVFSDRSQNRPKYGIYGLEPTADQNRKWGGVKAGEVCRGEGKGKKKERERKRRKMMIP
jgi:hypothetical protein